MGGNLNSSLPAGLSEAGTGLYIAWWLYLIVILIGLGLSVFFFLRYSAARRRASLPPVPGAPPPLAGQAAAGNGNGFLIAGIGSAVLLVLAPLIVMLVLQPWSGSGSWIVGRWSERPGCMGDTIEFTRDGTLMAEGRSGHYQLEGDQLTFNGLTQTVRHDGDRFSARSETFYRCGGSATAAATGAPFGEPSAPPAPSPSPYPSPSMPPAPTPAPAYAGWLVGRWSDSDCMRAMEFRADGTATTANGQPATYQVYQNGQGVHITINSSGRQLMGYMDPTPSGAVIRAYRPASQTINLRRC